MKSINPDDDRVPREDPLIVPESTTPTRKRRRVVPFTRRRFAAPRSADLGTWRSLFFMGQAPW